MPLTNAFLLGTCQVSCINLANQVLWQGTLAPGQFSPPFNGDSPGEKLQISVDSDGNAQLTLTSDSAYTGSYTLGVTPNYDVSQATDFVVRNIFMAYAISNSATASSDALISDGVTLQGSGSSWSPDPADVTGFGNEGLYLWEGVGT